MKFILMLLFIALLSTASIDAQIIKNLDFFQNMDVLEENAIDLDLDMDIDTQEDEMLLNEGLENESEKK